MSLFDQNDLGADEYSGKKENLFDSLTSKPIQRPFQPFGGQMPKSPAPRPQPVQYGSGPSPMAQTSVFDEADAFGQMTQAHDRIKKYSSEVGRSAKHYEGLYDDFKKNELTPFFESVGGFGDFDNDDDFISAIDELEKNELKTSKMDDGFFGGNKDKKLLAQQNLKNFSNWSQPNGLRDKMTRLRSEAQGRRQTADAAKQKEFELFEQITSVPLPAREALEESLKQRSAAPKSSKSVNDMLDSLPFERPEYNFLTGEVSNLEKVDPRKKIQDVNYLTGKPGKSSQAQAKRRQAAMRGDTEGFMSKRRFIAKERQLRDKGFFFSQSGLMDGRPIGLSRKDVDLLDIEEMRKAGITSYQGKPLDTAFDELGGEERLKLAKILESVYAARSNSLQSQLEFLKVAGSDKGEKARKKMEAARETESQQIALAAQNGLDNELFEQAETVGHLSAIGNAVQRGLLMSEMSNYTPDFLTNTLDADEIQRFIEIAQEVEKLPTSSTMKRVKATKSEGFLDAVGNLVFDNPMAIPEMFVESMASFLPSTIKWLIPSAGVGAGIGTIIAPGAGTAVGAAFGARASWGAASFVLEASGMALEGMQELGIDWENPKVFAAAWTNESVRDKIQTKMVQKGVPIAIADTLTGMMAGRVMGVANHTGKAMFKGGKLLNKAEFAKNTAAVPRFTKFQKTRNAAAELGFDSTMGMSGEYLGQWASKEAGEDWDWDAIAAEGIIGIGPGAVGAALEMRSNRSNYFGNAPVEITGEQRTENGTTGTINRAGYSATYQTFDNPEAMMAHFESINMPDVDPEARASSLEFTRRWVETMFKIRPDRMRNLKIAISPRTPAADGKNKGTFESRDGSDIIYLNESEFAANPMGAMFHESGHFARIMLYTDEELASIWSNLKDTEQLDAYAQYFTKEYEKSFEDFDKATQKKIRRAFNRTPKDVLAEEWFSYQWARTLDAKFNPHPDVAKGAKGFADKIVKPMFAEYTGTESVAGEKKGDDFAISQDILRFIEDGLNPSALREIDLAQSRLDSLEKEYEEGLPSQKAVNKNMRQRREVMNELERKLDAMNLTPAQKRNAAKLLNAMAGEKLLTETASFYTGRENLAMAASSDRDEIVEVEPDTKSGTLVNKKSTSEKEKEAVSQKSLGTARSKQKQEPLPGPGEAKLRAVQPAQKGSLPTLEEANTEEQTVLDRLIPETQEGRVKIAEAVERLDETRALMSDKKALQAKIKQVSSVLREMDNLSVAGVINGVLGLDQIFDASPISIISQLRKTVNPTRNRAPTSRDIENQLTEIIESVDEVAESLQLRIADIDNQIQSLENSEIKEVSEVKAEVKELNDKKKVVQDYLALIAPEQLNIDWKDTPHFFYSIKTESGKLEPLTLGFLATQKNFKGYKIVNRKGVEEKKTMNMKPQHVLWDFVSGGFDASRQTETAEDKLKSRTGGLTLKEYVMRLEAVRASAMFAKQKDIGKEAVTTDSRVVAYPSGYQVNEGVSFAAVVAERVRQMLMDNRRGKDAEQIPAFSENMTAEDVVALMMANGRTLELLGDPSESLKDFYKAMYIVERENQKSMMLTSNRPIVDFDEETPIQGLEPTDIDRDVFDEQFEYAEEDGNPFPKAEPGAPISKTLATIISLSARNKFLKDYIEMSIADTQQQDPTSLQGVPNQVSSVGSRKNDPELRELPPERRALNLWNQMTKEIRNLYRQLVQEKDKGKKKEIVEKLRDENFVIEYPPEFAPYFLTPEDLGVGRKKFEGNLSKAVPIASQGFKVLPRSKYKFRRPFENAADKIPATEEHEEFSAGKIYETFDVLSAFAEGRANTSVRTADYGFFEEVIQKAKERGGDIAKDAESLEKAMASLQSTPPLDLQDQNDRKRAEDILYEQAVELIQDPDDFEAVDSFDKQRTTIEANEQRIDRPIDEQSSRVDPLSSVDVSAVEFANYLLRGKVRQRLKTLADIPSSKYTDKEISQLPGGLGEGFMPFVFPDFIQDMHQKLGIKGFEKQIESLRTKVAGLEQTSEGLINRDSLDSISKDMEVLSRPIIQAVIDAGGVDMYGTFDPNSENVLQRDTITSQNFDRDESAEVRDDSGRGEENQVVNQKSDLSEAVTEDTGFGTGSSREALRERFLVELAEEPKVEEFIRNMSYEQLSEFMKEDMGPKINKVLRDELERRAINRSLTIAFTPDGSGRTLGSDALLTSEADPNLSKATLLGRLTNDRDEEYREEFKRWMEEKKDSIKKGTFKMNLVDRADPLKQFHRSLFNILKKAGIDESNPLYDMLNTHGRLHQYFGKGYEVVEQANLRFIEPIKDLMREYGVDQTRFGEYLLARAAPSRNLQLRARADEYLADIAKEEKNGVDSDKYKEQRKKFYDDEGNFKLDSGITEEEAKRVVLKMEEDKRFKAFAKKALPLYYRMNLEALNVLADNGMIQEITKESEDAGVSGFREKTAMKQASSRYDWFENGSDVIMPDDIGNYTYAPMQGFKDETQSYLDREEAWEEFGASGTSAGKGFDQKKGRGVLQGAFGRDYTGPNPDIVFAASINQYFNNNILAKKNEVAQTFGNMFEAIRDLTHPKSEKDTGDKPAFQKRATSKDAGDILSSLANLDEGMVKELKAEFDAIFEPVYEMEKNQKLYEYNLDKDGNGKLINVERRLNTVFQNDPLTFVYRRDGEAYLIKLKETPEGMRMADTMKNLRYESLPSILQFFNKGTRFMARMFTSMNPAFIIPNFFRDLGTAAIHLTEDGKKKIAGDALNMKNIGSFAKSIFKAEQMIAKGDNPNDNAEIKKLMKMDTKALANSNHPLANIARYQYAKKQGAKIGYFRHESIPDLIRGIQKDLKKSKSQGLTKKGLKGLGDFVESSNTAVENSIRMSTFWAAVKNGYSSDEAAVIARNVTVDFNQKGNLTQAFGALYVFFGASMNSMHRFVTSWNRRSPEDRIKMFGGIAAASMAVAIFNRLVDDDEDEEVPDYDTISTYKRDTNFIIPLPAGMPGFFNDEKDTGYLSIPLPLGYNLFWAAGQVAADMFSKNVLGRGGQGMIAGTLRLKDSAMNAFNPIGGATIATIGTPTLATPMVELYANKNFMGRPIRYEDDRFSVPKPAYLMDPKSTPEHWTALSKMTNEFMGGSDTVKGSVQGMLGGNPLLYADDEDIEFDISGNQMRHVFTGYLGGPGTIFDSALGSLISGAKGEMDIKETNDIPIVNRFLRATTYGASTRNTYRDLRDVVKNAEKAVEGAKTVPGLYAKVVNDNRPLLRMSSAISQFEAQKNKYNKQKKKIEASKTLSEEQKTQRVDDLQKKELELMIKVIKQAQKLGVR